MSNLVLPICSAKSSAAAPAMMPPSTKTSMITRSWLTPMSAAVSGFCATARTPRPARVRLM